MKTTTADIKFIQVEGENGFALQLETIGEKTRSVTVISNGSVIAKLQGEQYLEMCQLMIEATKKPEKTEDKK